MRIKGGMAILALSAVVTAAHAQLPLNPDTAAQIGSLPRIGGIATIDVITLRQNMMGVPLRYSNLLPGSETVQFAGRTLKRGVDYQIDVEAGVVYLMRSFKAGDIVRVGYRYDPAKVAQKKAQTQFSGLAPFSFNLGGNGLRVVMGFGMTERGADGNVTQSNVYGVNNRMNFGSASLGGLMLMGNREKVSQESDYEFRTAGGETETGRSHMMLQNLGVAMGGGALEVSYQDVSKNFTGFAAAQNAGYNEQQIGQLQKERGLKRFSMSMKDIGSGALKMSGGMREVTDGSSSIEWKSFGLQSGGLQLNWKSQRIDDKFKRFADIAETDREQLKKEVGMARESLSGSFAQKSGKMTFQMNQIADPDSSKITRRELGFEADKFKFWYGDQEVEADFRRMGSLKGDEQALWGRELGMKRQWFGLQSSLFGVGQPIKFQQRILESDQGAFDAFDASIQGKGWSLSHNAMSATSGFSSFGAMQDGERKEHVEKIGQMYEAGGIAFRGEENHWFGQSFGISRQSTRWTSELYKDLKLAVDHLEVMGANDSVTLDTFRLHGKWFKIDARRQNMGDDFNELPRLLELERNRLGMISGLDRTDFSVSANFSPSRSFLYSSMKADSPNGGASRQTLKYEDPKLQISMANREVDPGFHNVSQLVDPEKDLFATMRGFKHSEVKAAWNISPNLKFDMLLLDSGSASLNQKNYVHNYELKWKPDSTSSVFVKRDEQRLDDPLGVLFESKSDLLSLAKDFGRFGKLAYLKESREMEGSQALLPDMEKEVLSYETKINSKTSLKAQESRTTFDDGGKENVSTKSLSTEIAKNMGVSVSDMKIDREGEDRDEKKRGYGVWFDFGNGIRFVYGMAQHLAGETAPDTQNQTATLSGGTVGNVQVGNGSYGVNEWEGGRTQATGNFSLSTVKPMTFLGFTDLKISASLDTASDRAVWLKRNRLFSIGGKLGSYGLSYDYRSQVAPNGAQGVDRSVRFTTDQDEKKPLRAGFKYKQRNLPTGEEILIRDYSIVAKLWKGMELSHHLLTNPEIARGDAILGSITQARQENRWKLDYAQGPNFKFGGEWREFRDQNQPLTRLGGVNLTINEGKGSPLSLFYGVEESDANGTRRRNDRYHIRFDQKPGPNQQFSFFVGNVSYLRGAQTDQKRNNLTVQLDFQIRF